MNKSKIEWCDMTWNPVTGCYHNCYYCYAKRIAERFGKFPCEEGNCVVCGDCGLEPSYNCERYIPYEKVHELDNSIFTYNPKRVQPYPFGFEPTFHKYKLDDPKKKTKGVKIFVCSMADLFGDWVPDEWIKQIFDVVRECPQHTFIFLTKNPKRYRELVKNYYDPVELPENAYYGTTITKFDDKNKAMWLPNRYERKTFVSIEPLLDDFGDIVNTHWIIVGGQTGPGAVKPKPEWIQSIIDQARAAKVPIFLKNNLNWSEKIQEFPEGMEAKNEM